MADIKEAARDLGPVQWVTQVGDGQYMVLGDEVNYLPMPDEAGIVFLGHVLPESKKPSITVTVTPGYDIHSEPRAFDPRPATLRFEAADAHAEFTGQAGTPPQDVYVG